MKTKHNKCMAISLVTILSVLVISCEIGRAKNMQPAVSPRAAANPSATVKPKTAAPTAPVPTAPVPTEQNIPAPQAETTLSPKLALLPLGEIPESIIITVAKAIPAYYTWDVIILPAKPLPSQAWYAQRKRHRADKILDWLPEQLPEGAEKIMALTKKDISTTKGKHADWGICGLAELDGAHAVVSTFRIRKKIGVKGKEAKQEVFLTRLGELTAHEFGHMLGLEHCPNRGCIMEDAKGTVSTFNHSSGELCRSCRDKLGEESFAEVPN